MKEKLLFCNTNNSNVKDKIIIQNQFALTFVALWSYPLVLGPYMQGGIGDFLVRLEDFLFLDDINISIIIKHY